MSSFDVKENIMYWLASLSSHPTISRAMMKYVLVAKRPRQSFKILIFMVYLLRSINDWFFKFSDSNWCKNRVLCLLKLMQYWILWIYGFINAVKRKRLKLVCVYFHATMRRFTCRFMRMILGVYIVWCKIWLQI